MLPFETLDWLRRTYPSFNEFLLLQINERLHWFMGNFEVHRLLDADRLVTRALLGLVHPFSTRAAWATCRSRRKNSRTWPR